MPKAMNMPITPRPLSAQSLSSRRDLLAGLSGVALAGPVFGLAAAEAAPAVAECDDGELLRLCTALEAVLRHQNGFYRWRLAGQGGHLQGSRYIEDDSERNAAVDALDEPTSRLIEAVLESPPKTLAGIQAVARCLLLSAADVRAAVSDGIENYASLDFSFSEWALAVSLLRGLGGGTITNANCTDGSGSFLRDPRGAA